MKVTLQQIQESIANIANRNQYTEDILYELLAAYGRSPNAITQLRQGATNRATEPGEVLQKDVVYFKVVPAGTPLEIQIEDMYENPLTQRYKPRYLIVTDLKNLAAKDTLNNANPSISIKLSDIDRELAFFHGWTGDEIIDPKIEALADRRAADKMNLLYTAIEKVNQVKLTDPSNNFRHELNVFFTRLLFCFFAEDTNLFRSKQFTDAVKLTQTDGSDLQEFFDQLFIALDSVDNSNMPVPYCNFPHVNGSLFNTSKHAIAVPKFDAESRHLILECGSLDWSEINPDIFGTMFQGVVDPEYRDINGMDYTSVPNIMKVIEPLFLDDLHERFDAVYNTPSSLRELLDRIRKIKIFDPACGSGNFLIIAYKELRQLEGAILARLEELKIAKRKKPETNGVSLFNAEELELIQSDTVEVQLMSGVELSNFYGIEIDDFAHELAILSLYLAKHQMDSEFEKQFPVKLKHLPLIENKNIVKANAAQYDWNRVCENNGTDEIYLIGNPPYKGAARQTKDQKTDFSIYFGDEEYSRNLDYIAIWFIKGARYIAGTKSQLAFVSTNSVCQGEHVGIMFPKIFSENVEIGFAYTSFKWKNSARNNAGVTVIILSLRDSNERGIKTIFYHHIARQAQNINAYLADSYQEYILPSSLSISGFPDIKRANALTDDNNFNLTDELAEELRALNPNLIKHYYGAEEFINGKKRPILWLQDGDYEVYKNNRIISNKVEAVRRFRLGLKSADGKKLSAKPWLIKGSKAIIGSAIIIPRVSSERREYIPMGYLQENDIIGDSAIGAYSAEPWLLALLQSKMHMAWIRTVCGKLKTDYRYSSTLGYNTFPVKPLTQAEKDSLNSSARKILLTRAAHPDKTLADMYDPDKMPTDLREAHDDNDRLVDSLYRNSGFTNDEERLATLFDLYKQMTSEGEK